MKKISSTTAIFVAVFGILGVLLAAAIWQNVRPTGLDDFAQCLTDKGATVYEAWWCPVCQDQKALFGPSYRNVNAIECGAGQGQFNPQACPGITSTPTWTDAEGNQYPGLQSVERLSEIYGCELPA